jgi:hypothetical protein
MADVTEDLTVAQYSESKQVTPQAIYKSIQRYKKDLRGHLKQKQGKMWLDPYAQDYLDQRRADNKIIINRTAQEDRTKELEEQNKRLTEDKIALLQKVADLQEQFIQSQADKLALSQQLNDLQIKLIESEKTAPESAEEQPKEEEKEPEAKRSLLYRLFHRQ